MSRKPQKPTEAQRFRIVSRTLHYADENKHRELAIAGQFEQPVVLRRLNRFGYVEETRHMSQLSYDREAALGGVIEG